MAEDHNPNVATQAHEGIITIRLTATDGGRSRRAAAARRGGEGSPRAQLGDAVFGADETATIAQAVAALLERTGKTVAVAESCTGGEISARLTDVPGISAHLLESAVTYSNESKIRRLGVPRETLDRDGAVSASVAEAMARGMRSTSGADVALSVTGIAGPDGRDGGQAGWAGLRGACGRRRSARRGGPPRRGLSLRPSGRTRADQGPRRQARLEYAAALPRRRCDPAWLTRATMGKSEYAAPAAGIG